MKPTCPVCGSTDVSLVDPETAFCEVCEFEGDAGAFEKAGGITLKKKEKN